ncbi:MAG: hypothetical protein HGA44_06715 [Cellulomonadaceae bacterium]|nr:hypothetical protein [Cellulomonadaceae bacterium]
MSETPGTSADPETGAEGDSDQLDREDTLVERGVDDLLDEGWSPPDHPSRYSLETEREQYEGDTLDERLAQEEPEVWDREEAYAPGREPDRAGRLVAGAADLGGASASSLLADDAGVAGGAASAEEAAIHVVPDDAL